MLFLVVAVPVIILESGMMAWHVPAPEFRVLATDPSRIYQVISGSGAELAGVRAGDRILLLNEAPFNADDLPQVVRHWTVGETLGLVVLRTNGQVVNLAVPLVPVAASTFDTLARNTLAALFMWASSLLLLRQRFHHYEVRLLFLLAQAMALVLLFPPIPFLIWYHAHAVWADITGVSALLSTALLLHFHCSFPVVLGSARRRRWFLASLYGLTLAAAAGWIMFNSGWLPWGMAFVLLSYMALVVIGATIVLVYAYRRRATPDGRRRLRVILFGNLVAGGAMAVLYFLPLVVLGYPLLPDWIMWIALTAAPAAYVYATVRHNLFGMERLLNRALVYVFIAVGIFALYLVPLLVLDRLVPYDWLRHTYIMAGLTLVVALAFEGTRRRVQRVVDGFFYGGWYDYPKVVELVSAGLARSLDWQALADVLTRQVPALMQLGGAQLQMGEQATPPLEPALQPRLQFPLSSEGQPRGLWTVAARPDTDELSATDQRILKTLARQASIALSNVRLVQTLRHQLDEILASRKLLTSLEHQLLRMREEERQRLARDLHDGPIQSLVGLKMQLDLLARRPEVSEAPTPLTGVLSGMQAEVRTLLADLRQVCADLRPPMLDTLGLGAALRALTQDWSAQHDTPVHLELPPDAMLRDFAG